MSAGREHPDQAAAFSHADVIEIASCLVQGDDTRLVNYARQALITPITSMPSRQQLELEHGPVLGQLAFRIAQAAASIWAEPDVSRQDDRRGAVLERYVFEMIQLRASPSTVREVHVETPVCPHSGTQRTGRLDIVSTGNPFEAYECKLSGDFSQTDANELGDVWLTARAEGSECRPCFATLATMTRLRARLQFHGVELKERLYAATVHELALLRHGPPTMKIWG